MAVDARTELVGLVGGARALVDTLRGFGLREVAPGARIGATRLRPVAM